jgi:hypothetical protein
VIGTILACVAAVSIAGVGVYAWFAPRTAASLYGAPTQDLAGLALARAVGVRDVVLASIIGALALTNAREALTVTIAFSTLIAVFDFAIVARHLGAAGRRNLSLHALGALLFALTWLALRAGV